VGLVRGEALPPAEWGPPALVAAAFVGGQLCTYLALQYGDVSLATPVFGVKIILVAILTSLLAERAIDLRIWIAAILATIGVGVIQAGSGSAGSSGSSGDAELTWGRAALSIGLALLAAVCLTLFDFGLQHYGRVHGAERFLTTMFVFTGVLSCGLLPWTDSPGRLAEIGALWPLALATLLIAAQAISMSYALGRFGDVTRVNIVYALRGLWSVLLLWLVAHFSAAPVDHLSSRTLAFRLLGAVLLTVSVVVALG
jgi:drug/metabolite transporter (DMT)-like permease